jgi:two-component system, LuxR family, sensor kinase FixL
MRSKKRKKMQKKAATARRKASACAKPAAQSAARSSRCPASHAFSIVGMGASAGGQSVIEELATVNARLVAKVGDLEAAHLRLHSILAHVTDGIITFTEDGAIETFNPAAEEIFGYPASSVIGKKIDTLLPGSRTGGFIGDLLARAQGSFNRDTTGRRKNGTRVPLDLLVGEMHIGTQRVFIASVRDLTDPKEKEREMRELESTLAIISSAERQRVGVELHDHIGQLLSGTAMLARSLEQRLQTISSVDAGNAAAMVDQLQDVHRRIRDLARGLAPIETTPKGITDALTELAQSTESIHGIPCEYFGPQTANIESLEVCDHLYRIAQEAVTNAVRHAEAKKIRVSLQTDDHEWVLSVDDDGKGLPADPKKSGGIGHRIMRYRSDLIGGRLEISARKEGGTRIRCLLACPARS